MGASNPLGVLHEQLTKPYITQPKVLEYKYCLNGLVREFESGVKHETDVDLAVFWEMGSEYEKASSVISYLDTEQNHHRMHHGLTHRLNSSNSYFDVICLRELIQMLNEPTSAQKYQLERYGDEI